MPELTNSRVWSPAGTRLALGTIVWPRSAKNSRNFARISDAERYGIPASDRAGLTIRAMVPNGRSMLGRRGSVPPRTTGEWYKAGATRPVGALHHSPVVQRVRSGAGAHLVRPG